MKNKIFKIGLVYINTNNLGDIVIFDCAKYMIEKSLDSMGIKNYEIVPIDMGEKIANQTKPPKAFVEEQKEKYASAERHVFEWKTSKPYYYFLKNEIPRLELMDIIVFGGGGLIKFHEQYFYMYINEITETANTDNIPVVFNAVGIEGYQEDDPRCEILKNALNRTCVKAISTRDNLDLLRKKYIAREGIHTKLVCDPALWAKETYNMSKANNKSITGLGVIRPEIFKLYGVNVSKQMLLRFYEMIILELDKLGRSYRIFTNGGRADYRFIEELRQFMDRDDTFNKNVEPIPKTGKALVSMINNYERILSCRMHAAIIAYSMDKPVVSVVWNEKLRYFAEIIGQPASLVYSGDLNKKSLVMNKIFNSPSPKIKQSYKNSDYIFLHKQLRKYYWNRYLVKARRYYRAKKEAAVEKLTSK